MATPKVYTEKPKGWVWSGESHFAQHIYLSSARSGLQHHKDSIRYGHSLYRKPAYVDAVIVKVGATKGKNMVAFPYRIAVKPRDLTARPKPAPHGPYYIKREVGKPRR